MKQKRDYCPKCGTELLIPVGGYTRRLYCPTCKKRVYTKVSYESSTK